MTDWQNIGCRIRKDRWRQFKANAAISGDTTQSLLNKVIDAVNRLDWSKVSRTTQIEVVFVNDGSLETEGLGDK